MNTYLAAINRRLREIGTSPAQRRSILAEQESLLQELNDIDADLTEELGSATEYADHIAEQVYEPSSSRRYFSNPLRALSKRGRASLWDMDDPRVLQPHLLGFGWSVNWAAVAIKLGIVRPDDIDGDVVAAIPAQTMRSATLLPTALTVTHGVALALAWKRLPEKIRTSRKRTGKVNQKTASKATLLLPFAISAVGASLSAASSLDEPNREDALRVASLSTLTSAMAPSQLLSLLAEENSKLNPAFVRASVAATSIVASATCLIVPLRTGLKTVWKKAGAA